MKNPPGIQDLYEQRAWGCQKVLHVFHSVSDFLIVCYDLWYQMLGLSQEYSVLSIANSVSLASYCIDQLIAEYCFHVHINVYIHVIGYVG